MIGLPELSVALLVASGIYYFFHAYSHGHTRTLPPGPAGWPVIGNLLEMPISHQWLRFAEWGAKWGGIMSVRVVSQNIIILNSYEHAVALLNERSAIYSDRQTLTLASTIVGWNNILVLRPYGHDFREIRQLFHQFIGTRNKVAQYHPCVEEETGQFLAQLLHQPEDFVKHIRRTAGSIILALSYGYHVKEDDDDLVDLVNTGMDQFALLTTPGAFVVDTFPFLKHIPSWLPGGSWKQSVPLWTETLKGVCQVPHDFAKSQMVSETPTANFVADHLSENPDARKEEIIKYAASSLYTGGADTVVSAIHTFFLAMACYPEVQKKAQLEIDTVIGNDRLPTVADRDSLPYIHAICLEVYRWNPVGPLAVPHRLMEDDVYEGYHFPKGSIFIPNIWKMTHDEETHPRPMEFNPDRFVPSDKHTVERDPRGAIFGFGRRTCPGMHLADATVFASVAETLAVFNINKAVKNGVVVEPDLEYTSGTISHPKPFTCSIKPCSSKHEALILAAALA